MTSPDETTPNPVFAIPDEITPRVAMSRTDLGERGDITPSRLPPGGALDLEQMMAAALAAVEAVEAGEAKRGSGPHEPEVVELPDDLDGLALEDALPRPTPIRGMPTLSSSDLRAQMTTQLRDAKLALADARRLHDKARTENEQLHADLSVLRKRYQKLGQEHDELRKRLQRAELDLPDYGARQVLGAMLGPLDHLNDVFEHLAAHEPLTPEGREALSMLRAQWERALAGMQVTAYSALGQTYDPQVHECIAQTPNEAPAGQVIRQVGRGYLLSGRMLRSARVLVSTGPATTPE